MQKERDKFHFCAAGFAAPSDINQGASAEPEDSADARFIQKLRNNTAAERRAGYFCTTAVTYCLESPLPFLLAQKVM